MNNYSFGKILLLILSIFNSFCFSQDKKIDSLINLIKKDKEDTNKVRHLHQFGWQLMYNNPDTSIVLGRQALQLAEILSFSTDKTIARAGKKGIAKSLGLLGVFNHIKSDYPIALDYYLKALKIADEIGNKKLIAENLSNIGNIYLEKADYPKALDYYFKAVKMAETLGDKKEIAQNLGNIGIAYTEKAEYPKSLHYYFKALKLDEELGNKSGIARHLDNIGSVYRQQAAASTEHKAKEELFNKALDYYFKALKLSEELGNKYGMADDLGNIGNVYNLQTDYPRALDYYFRALKIKEELGDKGAIATNLGNIGTVFDDQATSSSEANMKRDLFSKALAHYFKALKLAEELEDKNGIARHFGNIGTLYIKTGQFALAEKHLKQALTLYDSLGELDATREFEKSLSYLYDTTGRVKLAFEHYKKYIAARDSINSEENQKKQARTEINYEFEKKEALTKAEQDKKDLIAEEEKQKQKLFLWFTICGLAVVIVVSGFIFRSLQINKKKNKIISEQKALVEHQKKVVEEKQKEILDSIHYAKRIQTALLTTHKYIERNLNILKK
ncbi:MAG: tetratricopeptide repeat protein [Bacteroidetes bacterium]|nr:tetratricopeptide repeat protein [Bacteroidota bacterium]